MTNKHVEYEGLLLAWISASKEAQVFGDAWVADGARWQSPLHIQLGHRVGAVAVILSMLEEVTTQEFRDGLFAMWAAIHDEDRGLL